MDKTPASLETGVLKCSELSEKEMPAFAGMTPTFKKK